jgi:hypothetical protein
MIRLFTVNKQIRHIFIFGVINNQGTDASAVIVRKGQISELGFVDEKLSFPFRQLEPTLYKFIS